MAEAPKPEEELRFSVPILGPVVAKGGLVFLFLGILGVGWVMWEVQKNHEITEASYRAQQHAEHEEILQWMEYNSCLNRLAVYVARTAKDQGIDFYNMPVDLVKCAPRFLGDGKK